MGEAAKVFEPRPRPTQRLQLYLTPDQMDVLKEEAERRGMSANEMVRKALYVYLGTGEALEVVRMDKAMKEWVGDRSNDTVEEIRFLYDLAQFGSGGHLAAALALQAAIDMTDDQTVRKLNAVKIFSELMAATESLGALCYAIRNIESGDGLALTYMTYYTRSLNETFDLMADDHPISSVLGLPTLKKILSAIPDGERDELPELYRYADGIIGNVKELRELKGQALVKAFNKTKHGFVVVEDVGLFDSGSASYQDDFAAIVVGSLTTDKKTRNISLELVEVEATRDWIDLVDRIRKAVVGICGLTILLLDHSLIHPPSEPN